jgi:dihydroflavonol-4-reductase
MRGITQIMTEIFVTGATGFIGSNLVRRLVDEGNEVTALLRKGSDHPYLSDLDIKMVGGDITDFKSVKRGMNGCAHVYHLAAAISFSKYDFDRLYNVNVIGTRNVMNAAIEAGVERLIHTSACAAIGVSDNGDVILNENSKTEIPLDNVYGYTKRLAEDEVLNACKKGLNGVIVNPCTVYGQGDRKLNSGFLIKNIYHNRFQIAPPGGTSVVSADDVVTGHLLAMERGVVGDRYILSERNMEYIDIFNRIASIVNGRRIRHKLPSFFYYPSVLFAISLECGLDLINKRSWLITPQIVSELFKFKYFSSEKAKKELKWKPEVNFETAIRKAFNYYKEKNLI